MLAINPITGMLTPTGAGAGGGGGTTLLNATGTLTKIVPGAAATPASFSLTAGTQGAMSESGTLTLTVNGMPINIDFGPNDGHDVQTGIVDGETASDTPNSAATISGNLRTYLINGAYPLDRSGTDPELIIATQNTGDDATLSIEVTSGSLSGCYPSLPSPATGVDMGESTGTRQVELAAAVSGKAHRLQSAAYALGGVLTAWTNADVQIGYWDGSTFSPCLKILNAYLTGGVFGFGGNITVEDINNLAVPVVGASLVARTLVDETTGSDLSLYVTYATE